MKKKDIIKKIGIFLPHQYGVSMATLLYDYFETANTLAGQDEFDVRFYAQEKIPISYSGLALQAETTIPSDLSVLIIVGTGGKSIEHIWESLEAQSPFVKKVLLKAKKNGALICATCTAAFYLADAGLVDGKSATSAWWLIDALRSRFPDVLWDEKKSLIPQGKIVTTGAGFTGLELAKNLLARFKKNSLERKIHRILLLPVKPIEQHPYVLLTQSRSHDFAEKMKSLMEKNWNETSPDFLADQLGMSLRTFIRKFKEQMGVPPGKWIQLKRIEKAKNLLINQMITVEEACYQSGYEDSSSFIRLFQREVGLSPREFRSTFRK